MCVGRFLAEKIKDICSLGAQRHDHGNMPTRSFDTEPAINASVSNTRMLVVFII